MTPGEIAVLQKEIGIAKAIFEAEEKEHAGSVYCEWIRGRVQALEWVLNYVSFYAQTDEANSTETKPEGS